ncbi:MAG: hypothetical protein HY780_03695 [Chloroflexi bacterium]|nr:hypothetical protein [Chloroflexota bacterium]
MERDARLYSIIDFWRRWHITLSAWLRDYLYIPLGGSRGSEFATMRNVMLTMVLGGLWHGANWTYVVWGAYHGVWLVLNQQSKKLNLGATRFAFLTHPILTRAATFILVIFGWTIFRSDNLSMAWYLMQSMVGLHGVDWAVLNTLSYGFWALLAFCFVVTQFAPNTWQFRITPRLRYAFALGILAVVCVLLLGQPSPFLYFQF